VQWAGIQAEIQNVSTRSFVLSAALVILNFSVYVVYDLIALRQIRQKLPLPCVAFTAPLSFSISNILGHSMITGLGFRYREYARYGLNLSQVTGIVIQNIEAWWLGYAFLSGLAFYNRPVGLLIAAAVAAYLSACFKFAGRRIWFRKLSFRLPDLRGGMMKIAAAALDITLTGATLFVLLPEGVHIDFARFLPLYLMAHLTGVLSFVPGGLGVVETVLLQLLRPFGGDAPILAGLLLYRIVHYILPAGIGFTCEVIAFLAGRRKPAPKTFTEETYGI
jgi:uncharacterized membrane protein YbhN (UPF0104 family)